MSNKKDKEIDFEDIMWYAKLNYYSNYLGLSKEYCLELIKKRNESKQEQHEG